MTTCDIIWFITVGAQKPDVEQSGSLLVSYSPNRTDVLTIHTDYSMKKETFNENEIIIIIVSTHTIHSIYEWIWLLKNE